MKIEININAFLISVGLTNMALGTGLLAIREPLGVIIIASGTIALYLGLHDVIEKD